MTSTGDAITDRWLSRRDERGPTHLRASECETALDLWELADHWLDKVPSELHHSWYQEGRAALRKLAERADPSLEPFAILALPCNPGRSWKAAP